jgi:hypothetical protein
MFFVLASEQCKQWSTMFSPETRRKMARLSTLFGPFFYAGARRALAQQYIKKFGQSQKGPHGACVLYFGSDDAIQACIDEIESTKTLDCRRHVRRPALPSRDFSIEFLTLVSR